MDKRIEKTLLLLSDFITINLAYILYFYIRVTSGKFDLMSMPDFWFPMLLVCAYWMSIFLFLGLYRSWFALSRFDELSSLAKSTFYGSLVLFFLIFIDDSSQGAPMGVRSVILIYWGLLVLCVGVGRLTIRASQRRLLIAGFGRRNAMVIGTCKTAVEVAEEINSHRGFGIDVIGFVDPLIPEEKCSPKALPILGTIADFSAVLEEKNIREVVFAFEHKHEDLVVDLIGQCEGRDIGMKIVPDLYEILSGQARTTQLYSVELVDINPVLMPAWEEKVKRIMDIIAAFIFLILASPIILFTSIAIKIDSEGPVFYSQDRCGLNGKIFKIFKFRSMYSNAEKSTGPVWAQKSDPRITPVGNFIRKVRIDELPQMWNVLKGEMSLIGPRPERPFFVEQFAKDIPYYKRRLRVRPGITGWAQVKHKYDESIEDVKNKLKYDLFYIENMSLRMDFKILLRTVIIVLFGKGQ